MSQTGGVELEHCTNAVSTMPLRAPQRVLDELTPGNGHIFTAQTGFLLVTVRNAKKLYNLVITIVIIDKINFRKLWLTTDVLYF